MTTTTVIREQAITVLLNGTFNSIKNVVPFNLQLEKPRLLEETIKIEFAVLIGITGDIKGKFILTGDTTVFGSIGESMFGMPIAGDMLTSFSGELGNMIAGGLSSNIITDGIKTDITSPTIMQGNTTLTGFKKAFHIPASFESIGEMEIYLLLD